MLIIPTYKSVTFTHTFWHTYTQYEWSDMKYETEDE